MSITACVLIIGNEILSGRTKDENLPWLATRLAESGIRLLEARVVPDIESAIVAAVNEVRPKYTYVFTTGGIGPTHDDITAASMAKAFGVAVEKNAGAAQRLEKYYGESLNDDRLRMANIPHGATLVENPVSGAPGFQMENVFIMAGVPNIMRGMFDNLLPRLKKGLPIVSKSVTCQLRESAIAAELAAIQQTYPAVDIGSYPLKKDTQFTTTLVVTGTDLVIIQKVIDDICAMILRHGAKSVKG